MKNIAVIFGGKSVEHDISIITALQTLSKVPHSYNVLPVYITHENKWICADNINKAETFLNFDKNVKNSKNIVIDFQSQSFLILNRNKVKQKIKIDCALLCNHGRFGEDGAIQGLLEFAQIPYTSSNISSSVLTMDKTLTKLMLKAENINCLPYVQFDKCSYNLNKSKLLEQVKTKLKFPCIIKPANLGSSVGIDICECEAQLDEKICSAFEFDENVLIEKFLTNAREFSCAVIKINNVPIASNVNEAKKGKFFSFEEKYIKKQSQDKSVIDKNLEQKIKKLAIKSYLALRCDGVVRVDFLYDSKSNKLFVNELNSIPGSLSFNMFDGSFEDLINVLIEEAIQKQNKKKQIIYQFNSKAIESFIKMNKSYKNLKRK